MARRGLGEIGLTSDSGQIAALREAGAIERIPICTEVLVPGPNVLAFEVHNGALASTDLTLRPALTATY